MNRKPRPGPINTTGQDVTPPARAAVDNCRASLGRRPTCSVPGREVKLRIAQDHAGSVWGVQYGCPGGGKPRAWSWRGVAWLTKSTHSLVKLMAAQPTRCPHCRLEGRKPRCMLYRAPPGPVSCVPRWKVSFHTDDPESRCAGSSRSAARRVRVVADGRQRSLAGRLRRGDRAELPG
jgi:hypothetical protein